MRTKSTAAILAIFLGGVGFHKFYLGQIGRGIFYLLFCWTFIPAIISFFEAISFLTYSQEAWDKKYNPNNINEKMLETMKAMKQELQDLKKVAQ